jgi:hypothetical protein
MEQPGGKAESFLRELGKRIDLFAAEAKEAGARMEGELRQRYEELKAAAARWQAESPNQDRWKEVEESLKKAGEELEKAFSAAFRKNEK